MMKNEKINIDAVAMVRKIRDDNYSVIKNKSRKERISWIHEQSKEANEILAISII